MAIVKTNTIGEILQMDPGLADVLLGIGMHCLGCPMSQMETIEEACQVHGVDVDELIAELNAKLAASQQTG
ncbi:MAG: DUF1858 domain-containing protein [Christensenellales bacterium]|jgi:hybrid cluster-associated redox disulfide protein